MKLNCNQVQERLADEEFSFEINAHVRQCDGCSEMVKGLTQLNEQISKASRDTPPEELNSRLFDKLSKLKSESEKESGDVKFYDLSQREGGMNKLYLIPISFCVFFVTYLTLASKSPPADTATYTYVGTLFGKNLFDFAQLAILSVGSVMIYLGKVNRLIIGALVVALAVVVQLFKVLA